MSDQASPAANGARSPGSQETSMAIFSWRWGGSLLVAAAAAWVWVNYTPIQFDPPKELLGVDMYSPPEQQQAAAQNSAELYWKNSLTILGGVGLCFGAVTLLAAWGRGMRQRWIPVMVGLVSGVVCGALAVVVGTFLRRYLDTIVTLPLVNESNRLLVTDTCVYMLISAVLVLPLGLAMLVGGGKQHVQKAVSIVLAGVVTGLLTPMAVSTMVHTSQTNEFPPKGLALTAIWMAVLAGLTFVFSTSTGTRAPKGRSSVQEEVA